MLTTKMNYSQLSLVPEETFIFPIMPSKLENNAAFRLTQRQAVEVNFQTAAIPIASILSWKTG